MARPGTSVAYQVSALRCCQSNDYLRLWHDGRRHLARFDRARSSIYLPLRRKLDGLRGAFRQSNSEDCRVEGRPSAYGRTA
jgi:hypothetical protein